MFRFVNFPFNFFVLFVLFFLFKKLIFEFLGLRFLTFYDGLQEPQAAVVSLTKENEKAILIALSKVLSLLKILLFAIRSPFNPNFCHSA